jgi:hypothetical protein
MTSTRWRLVRSPWFSECRQLAWKGRVAEEGIVFKGTSDPILNYAIGKCGDTEDVGRGRAVLLVLG